MPICFMFVAFVKEKFIFIRLSVCNVLLNFCHYFGICLEILIMWLRTEMEASGAEGGRIEGGWVGDLKPNQEGQTSIYSLLNHTQAPLESL